MTHRRARWLLWWGVYIIGVFILLNIIADAMGW
jgi:hypothetical protein